MKKDGLLTSFWTIDGKIFVKTSPIAQNAIVFGDMYLQCPVYQREA